MVLDTIDPVKHMQLLETINDIAMALDNGKQTDLLPLDFSKAFDKCLTNDFCINFYIMA